MARLPCRLEGHIFGVAATRSRAPPFRGNCAAARGRVRRCKCPPRPHTRLAAGGVEFGDAEVPAGRRVFLCPEIAGVHLGVDEWLLSQSVEWNERVAGEGAAFLQTGDADRRPQFSSEVADRPDKGAVRRDGVVQPLAHRAVADAVFAAPHLGKQRDVGPISLPPGNAAALCRGPPPGWRRGARSMENLLKIALLQAAASYLCPFALCSPGSSLECARFLRPVKTGVFPFYHARSAATRPAGETGGASPGISGGTVSPPSTILTGDVV